MLLAEVSESNPRQANARPLVVASSNNFPPINTLNKQGGLEGFASDISSAVARSLETDVRYIHSQIWNEVLDWLDSGEADFLHDVGYTVERESYLDFTTPIIEMAESIFVRSSQVDINQLSSLEGKTVACVNNHISHIFLKSYSGIRCNIVSTPGEGLSALVEGKVDAFVYPEQIVIYLAQTRRVADKVKIVGEPLRYLSWSMAVKNGNQALLKKLNTGIATIKENGEYQRIYNKWFGIKLISGYSQNEVVFISIVAILATLFIVVSINMLLHVRSIRKANKKLAESESNYRALADELPQCVFLKDIHSNYISCNQRYADSIGIKAEDITGRNDFDFHPENAEHYRAGDELIMSSGHSQGYEETYIENGRELYIEVIKTPVFNVAGELTGVLGIFWDITERKRAKKEQGRLQRELYHSQKMEALGNLSGGIAHDFNNIMGIIAGNAELAQKRQLSFVKDAKSEKYLNNIMLAGNRASDLVAKMMIFSSNDQLPTRALDLAPNIQADIALLKALLPSSIVIEFDFSAELPKAMIDTTSLQQILMNLCLNAKDAMDGVGQLFIKLHLVRNIDTECASCHKTIKGEWLELSISDTGTGIKEQVIQHMFDPFFTSKEVGKGTGLGLSVVNSILTNLGAHIIVDSTEGQGSTFRLLFVPITEEVETRGLTDIQNVIETRGHGQEILIVDDEPVLGDFFLELMSINGYQATLETNSLKALSLFEAEPDRFKLLITDQTMPQLTGFELANKLRKLNPHLPIILASGYSEFVGEKEASTKNIHYLSKPVDSQKMLELTAKLLA